MRRSTAWLTLALTVWLLLTSAAPALAYIGPGAGFALMSLAFVLVTTVLVVLATVYRPPSPSSSILTRRSPR